MAQHFEPTFESLHQFTAPEWFRDAKFGIWSHWGPQCVPMYGDWYARSMYIEGSDCYKYHVRHYGHPSKFGYKDLCELWKAEKFDPDDLMAKYYKAGARYFMSQGCHHDHFCDYDSAVNPMNSVNVGPKKDIVALWKAAAKKYDLPFGISEHVAASFGWWSVNKGCDKYGPYAGVPYDGNDPAFRDFYHDNGYLGAEPHQPWYVDDKKFHAYWQKLVTEMIDTFQPELVYCDGSLPFGGHWQDPGLRTADPEAYKEGLEVVAHLYNTSIEKYGENRALFLQKDKSPEIYKVGILDVEKSQLPGILSDPWHTDTCIGNWFYDFRANYKRPDQIIEMLVDIISKNGSMLLSIPQLPDGTIDDEEEYILAELADWFSVNAEAVYATRPWKEFREGPTLVTINGFREDKTNWQPNDFRFVQKDNAIYTFCLGIHGGMNATINSFRDWEICSVELLGYGPVPFRQALGTLIVELPDQLPVKYTNVLKIR